MAYSITVDDEHGLITVRLSGEVRLADFANAREELYTSGQLALKRRVLADLTGVTSWLTSSKQFRALAQLEAGRCPRVRLRRVAFVAPLDSVYGDLRAWVVMTNKLPFPRRVFRDKGSAMRWLARGELLEQ